MKKVYVPKGIIPVPPTPFTDDDKIDCNEYQKVLNYDIERGAHCMCIGGSTGEFSTMTMEERKTLIKCAAEVTKGRVPMMAHTTCHSLSATLELSKYSVECGADSLMLLTPYYLKTTPKGTYDYFETIAKTFPETGLCLYNVPANTAVNISAEEVIELAKIPNMVAIKDCTDPTHTNQIIEGTQNLVFESSTGREAMILANLAQGGSGGMGVMATIMPKELVIMYNLLQQNNWVEALKIDLSLRKLALLVDEEPNPAPVKEVLNLLGFNYGSPRLPVQKCSSELRELMKAELVKLGYEVC